MEKFLSISGDTQSVMELLYGKFQGKKEIKKEEKYETVQTSILPEAITDWKKVKSIVDNGDVSKYFKIGQFLTVYSPIWGFIEWEIVRLEKDGLYMISRHIIAEMPFDAEELSEKDGKKNVGGRSDWGSNNPLHCAPHKFLNSDKPVGKWWKSSTPFDNTPEESKTLPGFLYRMPKDFLDCVVPTEVEMAIPECDGGGKKKQSLRFFLPSAEEIFSKDGKKPFFQISSLKKFGYWWLRSPRPSSSYFVYYVYTSGAQYSHIAFNTNGVLPACRVGRA